MKQGTRLRKQQSQSWSFGLLPTTYYSFLEELLWLTVGWARSQHERNSYGWQRAAPLWLALNHCRWRNPYTLERNHSIIESLRLEKTVKVIQSSHQSMYLSAISARLLNTSRDRDSTTSLGSMFQWVTTLSLKLEPVRIQFSACSLNSCIVQVFLMLSLLIMNLRCILERLVPQEKSFNWGTCCTFPNQYCNPIIMPI